MDSIARLCKIKSDKKSIPSRFDDEAECAYQVQMCLIASSFKQFIF